MNRFNYVEDFNKNIKEIFSNDVFEQMCIIGLKIVPFDNLADSDKLFLQKYLKKKSKTVRKTTSVIKPYSSISFYYNYRANVISCEQIKIRKSHYDNDLTKVDSVHTIFEDRIFPVILKSEFDDFVRLLKSQHWFFRWNSEKTAIIVAKKNDFSAEFNTKSFKAIFNAHYEFVENSLTSRNMSIKKGNSFVERFKRNDSGEWGFEKSLESTLQSIIKYVEHEFREDFSNDECSIRLFRLTNNRKLSFAWRCVFGKKLANSPLNDEKYNTDISKRVCDYYFGRTNKDEIAINNVIEPTLPMGFSSDGKYYLVLPVSKNCQKVPFRYAIVFENTSRYKSYMLDNIELLISEYFNSYIDKIKYNLILELQQKLFSTYCDSGIDAKQHLIDETKNIYNSIIYITNAYSATLRLYNPTTKCLIKYVDVSNREAQQQDVNYEDNYQELNVISEEYTSLNCRTFLLQPSCKNDGECQSCKNYALYIRDRSVEEREWNFKKEAYKDLPYAKTFTSKQTRKETQSELCIPFFYKNVIIGTMNFESPVPYAFDDECEISTNGSIQYNSSKNTDKYVVLKLNSFFNTIKSTLQNYYALLLERIDVKQLSRLSKFETSLHELKNAVNSDESLDSYKPYIRTLLESAKSINVEINEVECVNLKEYIFELRNERISSFYEKTGDMTVVRKESFNNTEFLRTHLPIYIEENKARPVLISSEATHCIGAIYRNLLNNHFNHGDLLNDKLSIRYISKNGILSIVQEFKKPIICNPEWFYSPHNALKETSSGLFIIGAFVRQLGGYIFTQYCEKYLDYDNLLERFDIHINLSCRSADKRV